MAGLSYKDAGVDIKAKGKFTSDIYHQLRRTFGPRVIENPGGFAGLFALNYDSKLFSKKLQHPILVS
ncbi:MAG: phosphoribosylformylglycinamidine cyclo-ligase, partial [Gammaproteobacteria bacterium]|nr:phosphoribosylformylglycinamidine cyclo-ligase [Gammaproteobacteria bacterium]